jgi:segregation and condensation protein B
VDKLALYVESLIFAATTPISRKDIRYALENAFEVKIPQEDIEQALTDLQDKYMSDEYAFEMTEIAEGFQFLTKPAYHGVIGSYLKLVSRRRLSKVALETLAIIAYKQPVTKSALEQIRGVNSDYAIQKLLEKELIEIAGRSDGPGRPLTYITSEKFMDYFGLKNISDLPKLKDLHTAENIIGGDDALDEAIDFGNALKEAEEVEEMEEVEENEEVEEVEEVEEMEENEEGDASAELQHPEEETEETAAPAIYSRRDEEEVEEMDSPAELQRPEEETEETAAPAIYSRRDEEEVGEEGDIGGMGEAEEEEKIEDVEFVEAEDSGEQDPPTHV